MTIIVRPGRTSGVLEIVYLDEVTTALRWSAIDIGHEVMGVKSIPVAIVDFSEAKLVMSFQEVAEFQTKVATSEDLDQTLAIYVVGPHRQALEAEAAVGNSLGRIIELVDTIDEAYAFLADMECGL